MWNVSIVTVTLNNAEGLEKTLNSVACLNYQPFELIIIDGCSMDNTLEVVEKYRKYLTIVFKSERDEGIYDAMNKGRSLAKGDYIHYLNAGDYVIGEPYLHYKDVMGVFVNKNKFLHLAGAHTFHLGYCHQGLLFKKGHPSYDCKYKIAADFKLILDCFPDGFKNVVTEDKNSGVVYDVSGVSSRRWIKRDIEIMQILICEGRVYYFFLFFLKFIFKSPIKLFSDFFSYSQKKL